LNGRTLYRLAHWGLGGPVEARNLRVADPYAAELVELGQLVSVVYLTRKAGDSGPTEYEHDFSRPMPVLAFHSGGLVICGGRYRVGMRGIIG
jgi:hypothetical protein